MYRFLKKDRSDITDEVVNYNLSLIQNLMYTKPWYQSKTMWIAIAQGAVGVIVAVYSANPALAGVGWLAVVKSILDMFVRSNTTVGIS